MDAIINIEANIGVEETIEKVAAAKGTNFGNFIGRTYGKIKAYLKGQKTTAEQEVIRSNPLTAIDEFFGNRGRQIYNATFGKLASAYSKYETEVKGISERLNKIEAKLQKKFKGNALVKEKFKMKYYQMQREFEANPTQDVYEADAWIEATIADENLTGFYNEESIAMLKEIQKEFKGKSSEEILSTFGPEVTSALREMDSINEGIVPKTLFTSGVIRGEQATMFNFYTHHNVIGDNAEQLAQARKTAFTSPGSTKAGTVNERTEGAKAISFDPFYDLSTASRGLLLDYHMSPVNREVLRTTQRLEEKLKKGSKAQRLGAQALNRSVKEVLSNVFDANAQEFSNGDAFVEKVKKLSYQATLASGPRAISELLSNAGFAMGAAPGQFLSGMTKYGALSRKSSSVQIMDNVGSAQTQKLYEQGVAGSKHVESTISTGKRKQAQAVSDFQDSVNNKASLLGKPVTWTAGKIDDFANAIISTPDKMVSRPLWFGAFAESFKKNAGVEVDFDKIQANDKAYMEEHAEAIKKARLDADQLSVMSGASNNPFSGILKLQQNKKDSSAKSAYKILSGYLQRFLMYEYATAKTAVMSLMGNGQLSRKQGAGVMAGVMMRMTAYGVIYAVLSEMIAEAFGAGDEEEPDYAEMVKNDFIGSGLTLLLGRNLTAFPKIPINGAIESVNSVFHGDDYDPFKDSLVFSQIGGQDFRFGKSFADWLVKLAGPYGTPIKGIDYVWKDVAKYHQTKNEKKKEDLLDKITEKLALQGLGHAGLIPFFKDINKLYKKQQYIESKNKRKSKGGLGLDLDLDLDLNLDLDLDLDL